MDKRKTEIRNDLIRQITSTRADLDEKWNALIFRIRPGKVWLNLLIKLGLRAKEPELRYNTARIRNRMNNWELERKILHNDQHLGDKDVTDLPRTDPLSGADLQSPAKPGSPRKPLPKLNEEDAPSGLSRGPI